MEVHVSWKPPRSPHGLIQEELWPDEWKILVSCLLLNQTSRKQLDSIIGKFFKKYPTPDHMATADEDELKEYIRPLGLANKRAKTLIRFSREYLAIPWVTASELYGCGKYADDTWRIFCLGDWRAVKPNDHALNNYHDYLKSLGGSYNA